MQRARANKVFRVTMAFLAVLLTVALIATTLALPQIHASTSTPDFDTRVARRLLYTALHLQDGPQDNYFYSDCHTSVHVIVTSGSNAGKLRLLVAWPACNSGSIAFFCSGERPGGCIEHWSRQLRRRGCGGTFNQVGSRRCFWI
jgi:hypothetical protein